MKLGSIKSSIASVAIVIIFSKAIGFLREIIIADKFGTSADYDMYLIAIMLPALFYGVVNYASFYLLVPYFSEVKIKAESNSTDQTSPQFYWSIVNQNFLIALLLVVTIIALAPYLMKLWASSYSLEQFGQIVFYSRVTAVIIVLGATEATMRAYLNSRHITTFPTAGFIMFNLTSIASIMLMHDQFGVGAIAFGLVGGLFLQNLFLLIRLFFLSNGIKYSFSFSSELGSKILFTAMVLFLIELLNKAFFLIDRYFAVQFSDGVISSLNYSHVLIQLPEAVVGFAIGSVLFPHFSESSINDIGRFASLYKKSIIASLFLSIPLAIFFYSSALDIVTLVFMRGSFDIESAKMTSQLLIPFAPSIVALFVITTSVRACHAGGWGKQVLRFTLLLFFIKFIATYLLVNQIGFVGLSAATAFSQVTMSVILLLFISNKIGGEERQADFAKILGKISVASALTFIAVNYFSAMVMTSFETASWVALLIKSAITFVTVVSVFFFFCYLLGLAKEIKSLLHWKRKTS